MNYNKNDIEFYVLNKDYKDLTLAELELIQTEIKTEEEFYSMKQLLKSIAAVNDEEIEPAPALRASLIKDFEKARWKKGIEVGETSVVQLEKQETKTKKNKFIVWFSMAASLLLLIGLAYNKDIFFSPTNKQLAFHETSDTIKEAKTTVNQPQEIKKETKSIESDVDAEKENEEKEETARITNNSEAPLEQKNSVSAKRLTKPTLQNKQTAPAYDNKNDFLDSEMLAEEEVSLELVMEETIEVTSLDDMGDDLVVDFSSKDKKTTKDSESSSLENDKDLIGLLYTAL